MKKKILAVNITIIALGVIGCSTFTTTQTDERTNEKTGEKTKISTQAKARTFFDAKSELARFKASQTDKAQTASVGNLGQESSGSNAVQIIKIVVEGASKAVVP